MRRRASWYPVLRLGVAVAAAAPSAVASAAEAPPSPAVGRPAFVASAALGYVGAQRCGECHAFALRVWQGSRHATAHQSLSAEQLGDARCNTCHSLGPRSGEQFVGVQCESCHGPGKYYQPDYVMRDRELSRAVGLVETQPAQCLQCHTESAPSVSPFDYAALWALIDHSRAAEQRWQQARDQAVSATPSAATP